MPVGSTGVILITVPLNSASAGNVSVYWVRSSPT